jgi:hypothetical protein
MASARRCKRRHEIKQMLLRTPLQAAQRRLCDSYFTEDPFSSLAGAGAVLELSLRGSSRVSPSISQQA